MRPLNQKMCFALFRCSASECESRLEILRLRSCGRWSAARRYAKPRSGREDSGRLHELIAKGKAQAIDLRAIRSVFRRGTEGIARPVLAKVKWFDTSQNSRLSTTRVFHDQLSIKPFKTGFSCIRYKSYKAYKWSIYCNEGDIKPIIIGYERT